MKQKGVVLLSVGSQGYAYMAFNLALSIKHLSPSLHITLCSDKHIEYIPKEWRDVFDDIIPLSEDSFTTNNRLDPAKLKTHLVDYLPYKYNLYLDVDAIAMSDLNPFIDSLIDDGRDLICTVVDKGDTSNEDIAYSVWAKTSDIVDRFEIQKSNQVLAIQSSWMFIVKNKKSKSILDKVKREFQVGFDVSKLKEKWGGGLPDELFYSGVFSFLGLEPNCKQQILYFGDAAPRLDSQSIKSKYALLSLFGNGTGRTKTPIKYWELYDYEMRKICDGKKYKHIFKGDIIKKFKHANR